MRKRNNVKQLNRVSSHRNAMMRNMVTSLFEHERIVTTRARSKALRPLAERLITRARKSLDEGLSPEARLHNRREILRQIPDRGVSTKLLEELAGRYKDRPGGYTRIIHLPDRASDSAQMSVIELVDRREKVRRRKVAEEDKKALAPDAKKPGKIKKTEEVSEKGPVEDKKDKDQKKRKWFWGFKKKKGDEHA